jgi:hypothetical protein
MEGSAQHPFVIETSDGTVIGGAQTESDAVTLAAGAVAVVRGTLLVRDSGSGSVAAQIGRPPEAQTPGQIGPRLDSINPASTPVGLPPQVLICTGSGFVEGAEILWGDTAQATTFNDPTEVSCRLALDWEPSVGDQVAVQVQNPDGNVSGTLYFTWEADPVPPEEE